MGATKESNGWKKTFLKAKTMTAIWFLVVAVLGALGTGILGYHNFMTRFEDVEEGVINISIYTENLVRNQQIVISAIKEDASEDAKQILGKVEPFPIIIPRELVR